MSLPLTVDSSIYADYLEGPRLKLSPRWVRVKFGGEIIADSKQVLLLRQYGPHQLPTYYFPLADVRRAALKPGSNQSQTDQMKYWLGNDLHDGVGHHLASLLRKTELALSLLEKDAAAARTKIDEVRQGTHAAMGTVRNLAHTLHPPELELLGLTGALSERAAQIDGLEGLRVLFEAPASLPPLSVATEAAAYYIALEALSNVQRHARASHCTLRLALSTRAVCAASPLILLGAPILEIEVKDDGRGLPPGDQRGLGVASMRERAVEVGGMCLIEPRAEGGVRVLARLPCLEVGPAGR